jgi:flagellar hook-associated protein 3 FlgL
MRVTTEIQSQQAILNVQMTYAKMAKLQSQISSGNQVQTASDNPIGALQILQNNTQAQQFKTDLSSIQDASGVLKTSVSALTQAQKILASVKSTALTANNPTNQPGANSALAAQVTSAINQLLTAANTQLPDGTYLFGGTASTSAPFSVTSSDSGGQPTAISYQGSNQAAQIVVGKAISVNTLLAGNSVFQTSNGGATVFSGATGAQPGTGTNTAQGTGTLQVLHTLTSFAGSSGVSAGLSSASNDTILGPSGTNNLVINDTSGDGSSGTVSLNGGPAVAFSNTDNDLMVTGPAGEVVYLDTTSIAAGFNGTSAVTSDGDLSIDGGATTTPIDFSANQVVTDGTTGAITNVNSSNIRRAGDQQVDYTGVSDIFKTLIALRDTISNTQNLSSTDRAAALTQQIGVLDQFSTALARPLGDQATQVQFLSNLQSRTVDLQTNLKEATSNIQSTDMAAAIVALQQQQTLYQAGLQLTASINQLSLANFIK